jgi:dUTPase
MSMGIENMANIVRWLSSENTPNDIMWLKIYVEEDEELRTLYKNAMEKHNKKVLEMMESKETHVDSGFDVYVPKSSEIGKEYYHEFECGKSNKLDSRISCNAQKLEVIKDELKQTNSAFYVYPRSSISKTRLRLSNNVGIIDSGYRGNLIGMFDVIENDSNLTKKLIEVESHTRLLQICSPTLGPMFVQIVERKEDLGITERGSGGIGSTGK